MREKINEVLNKQDKKSACVSTVGENCGLIMRGPRTFLK